MPHTFCATSRSSFVSLARYTSPIPPSPILAGTEYGPGVGLTRESWVYYGSAMLRLLEHGVFGVENLQPRNNSGHSEHVLDSLANSDESQAPRSFGQELLSTEYFSEAGAVQRGYRGEVEHDMRLRLFAEAIDVLSQRRGRFAEGEGPLEIEDRHVPYDAFCDDHRTTRHQWFKNRRFAFALGFLL